MNASWLLKFLLFSVLLTVFFVGCSAARPSAEGQTMPRRMVDYLERMGLMDEVVSFSYGEERRWKHPLYAMELGRPDVCWTVEMKDGATLCFFPMGEWVYTVARHDEEALSDLDERYLADIPNLKTVMATMRNMVGKDVRIVGVAKEGKVWVVSAYKTHGIIYMGPPTRYYFNGGDFLYGTISA